MDYKLIKVDSCPIAQLDTTHLILHILYRRVNLCNSLGLNCMGLPILSTSTLTWRGCSRESVYKLFRRMLRIRDKLGKDIKLLELDGIRSYLRISLSKGSLYIYDGYMVNRNDCRKVSRCVVVNNVSLLYMYLLIRLAERNMVILNIPDALIWVSKIFGVNTATAILDFVHDYIETGALLSSADTLLSMLNMLGLSLTRQQFENALVPARRALNVLRGA